MIRSSLESKLYILLRSFPIKRLSLPPEPTANRPRPSLARPSRTLVLAVLASLLVLVILAYRTRGLSFRWDLLLATLEHVDWRWLMVSICLILLINVGRALRWQVMLRPSGHQLGVWRLTSDTAIGFTAGVVLGRVGEVVRPYLIAVQAGLPFSSQAAAWLLERMLDLLAVLLLCGYALIRVPSHSWRLGPKVQDALVAGGYSLALAGALCLVVLLAFRQPNGVAQRRLLSAITFLPQRHWQRIASMLEAFSQGMECTRNPRLLALLLGYTVLQWAVIVAGTLALFQGFQATHGFGFLDVLVLMAFMTLGGLVQVPGLGGGIQVASIVALTRLYGVPLESATGIAIVLWIVSSLTIVPFGIACAFHEGLNWSKLKLLSTKQILEDPQA
ncbi:MAG TPA: lysylphosphatidylglycerol synthase transmembrane domain-containing protein [Bryobacteraceae bacterium]|nr:lysylphosphatidylglycerol synthase transmembrane domain-containing protein [Bryobacteraceae bacterium]